MKKIISIMLMLLCISLGVSAARCKAMKQNGKQCTRTAKVNGYCKRHIKEATLPTRPSPKATQPHVSKCRYVYNGVHCDKKATKGQYCFTHYNMVHGICIYPAKCKVKGCNNIANIYNKDGYCNLHHNSPMDHSPTNVRREIIKDFIHHPHQSRQPRKATH